MFQGFEYLRRFLIDKGNPQNFPFQKKLRNFVTLNFCQDSARIRIREKYFRSDPDPGKHFPDPQPCIQLYISPL